MATRPNYMEESNPSEKSNIPAEEDVLSCLLYNPKTIVKVVDTLKTEDFYRDAHRMIYEAILHLYQQNRSTAIENVAEELSRRKQLDTVGGMPFLHNLSNSNAVMKKVEDHAELVIRKAIFRRLWFAAYEIAALAHDEDDDALERAEQLIYDINVGSDTKSATTLSDALDRYMLNLERRRREREEGIARGIPTGFSELDHILGGLQPSALITLAALTGVGKTAFALNVATYAVQHAKRAIFFSLEMDEEDLVQRVLSMDTQIDQTLLRDADVDDVQMRALRARVQALRQCQLLIDDRTTLLANIRNKARHEHHKKKLDLIVVDYTQLVDVTLDGRGKHETRAEEVGRISRELKKLARELKVPVLALAQVNRDVEKRQQKVPMLSDLNESGGMARDSDVVMFIYCTEDQMELREACRAFTVTVKVAKNRNGRIDEVPLDFSPRITRFKDHNDQWEDASNGNYRE